MEEMNELFYHDAYLKEFEAEVIECKLEKDQYLIQLSDTAFYPEGGGQPADYGYLNDVKVTNTLRKNGVVYHYCDKPLSGKVTGKIDWQRRFDHMQQHSGEHIFSGIVHKNFGYDNVGFHMGEYEITLDFDGVIPVEKLVDLENQANELIYRNVEIKQLYPTGEQLKAMDYRSKKELTGKVRIIDIEDGDVCACCGTHVKYTGEIGLIKVVGSTNKKDGTRVMILCGKRALDFVQKMTDIDHNISVMLSAKPFEVDKAVNQLLDRYNYTKIQLSKFVKSYLDGIVNKMEYQSIQILIEDDLDSNDIRYFVNKAIDEGKCDLAVGLCKKNEVYNYLIRSDKYDLRSMAKQLNSLLSGKGGGNNQLVQGSFACQEMTVSQMETIVSDLLK